MWKSQKKVQSTCVHSENEENERALSSFLVMLKTAEWNKEYYEQSNQQPQPRAVRRSACIAPTTSLPSQSTVQSTHESQCSIRFLLQFEIEIKSLLC